jgi:hypothetical protein
VTQLAILDTVHNYAKTCNIDETEGTGYGKTKLIDLKVEVGRPVKRWSDEFRVSNHTPTA